MDEYIKKAEILTRYFGIYGKGNFDLSLEEIARIVEFIITKKENQFLDLNLKELYERLATTRLG
jgi:hypothetical protein